MKTKCASCGWQDENTDRNVSHLLVNHLRACPQRDVFRHVPRWTIIDDVLEGAWTTLDVNEPFWMPGFNWNSPGQRVDPVRVAPLSTWHRFSPEGERMIGVSPAPPTPPAPRLESEVVNGDIVHDGYTRQPIRCLACKADLRAGGHLGTCAHSVMHNDALVLDLLAELVLAWEDEHGVDHNPEQPPFGIAVYLERSGFTWADVDRHATVLHDARFPDLSSRADEPRPIDRRFLGQPTSARFEATLMRPARDVFGEAPDPETFEL